jgi:6-phosphogluconate dehydrogenase
MQAYAEGFQILQETDSERLAEDERFTLDIAAIAELWRHGSIVSSLLLDVIAEALHNDARLADLSGVVGDTGEGRWTIETAIERGIPAMALATALNARFRSRRQPNFADKLISAMRRGFGGHSEAQGKG